MTYTRAFPFLAGDDTLAPGANYKQGPFLFHGYFSFPASLDPRALQQLSPTAQNPFLFFAIITSLAYKPGQRPGCPTAALDLKPFTSSENQVRLGMP